MATRGLGLLSILATDNRYVHFSCQASCKMLKNPKRGHKL